MKQNAIRSGEMFHYIVAGQGPGEIFETWAGNPMDAVRSAYDAAGGGGALFDVVAAGPARPGYMAVYAGNGPSIFGIGRSTSFEMLEKARSILTEMAVPVMQVQAVSESPMVVVSIQPSAIEHAFVKSSATSGERRERMASMVDKLRAIVSPNPGGIFVDTLPGTTDGPLLRVHARGIPLFRLARMTKALEATAFTEISAQNEALLRMAATR